MLVVYKNVLCCRKVLQILAWIKKKIDIYRVNLRGIAEASIQTVALSNAQMRYLNNIFFHNFATALAFDGKIEYTVLLVATSPLIFRAIKLRCKFIYNECIDM